MGIHYDCDPGQDDAVALLFALGAGIHIDSISVVGGNVDVRQCARNALQLLELTNNTDIPVYVGAALPLRRQAMPLRDVFGESGMDGANLPLPSIKPASLSAQDCLLRQSFSKTLVATGPLTNLALAVQKNSNFATWIEHLIIMGGCTKPEHIHGRMGNIPIKGSDGWAEYNFAVDPEAEKTVFCAGFRKISLIGLDITRSVLFNGVIEQALRQSGGRIAKVAADILACVGSDDRTDYASLRACPDDPVRGLHDVVAMGYLTDPDIFTVQTMPLRIVADDPPAQSGQSLIDPVHPDHPAVDVITDLAREKFREKMVAYLSALE